MASDLANPRLAGEEAEPRRSDVDAAKLARRLRAGQRGAKTAAGPGEAGDAFYDAALDRCCQLYVRAVVQVPTFVGRSAAEILSRQLAGRLLT